MLVGLVEDEMVSVMLFAFRDIFLKIWNLQFFVRLGFASLVSGFIL